MSNSKCIGNIRKFTETGDIGGERLLVVLKNDINDDNTLEKDIDRFLLTEVEYIKRNRKGELSALVFVDENEEFPCDMDDTSLSEMEVFEIVDDKPDGASLPTYKQLAIWLREEYGRAVLTFDGKVIMSLDYDINKSYDQVEGITKYTTDLDNDNAWKDISTFIEDEDSDGDEYWKIVK